jgi:flagellar biosynthetic protein FlhB
MAFGEGTDQERTEQPTGKRREEARREGRVASSRELTGAVVLLGALGVSTLTAPELLADTLAAFRAGFDPLTAGDLTPDGAVALGLRTARAALGLGWPLISVTAMLAVAASLLQTRFVLSTKALRPQWERISPLHGLGRIFSLRGLVELLKSVSKLALVGGIGFVTVRGDWGLLLRAGDGGAATLVSAVGRVVWDVWLGIGLAYLALAAFDYAYQWWELEKSLRMTKEEVQREHKEQNGSPHVRGRIRALHQKMAKRQLAVEVRRADVVLRNPTHVAVAIRYESGAMRAPRVVAKGERLMARHIIEIAADAGVPIVENPPLARALFKAVQVGREIPADLYRAVAQVLAYVYSLKGREH